MRNRKWMQKVGSVLLGTALTTSLIPASMMMPVLAQEGDSFVKASDSDQMASDPELVVSNVIGTGDERTINFNENWKFSLSDPSGAQNGAFDDSKWQQVNLPHDYSLSQDYSGSMEAESGYKPGGVGWYRKTFTADANIADKNVIVEFNGVYMDADVYLNGVKLGNHPYGYTAFAFDLSEHLNPGENVIAVRVNHQTPSSRWYSGSGIYRDVNVTVTDKVHADYKGIFVTTPGLEDNQKQAATKVETTVVNDTDAAAEVSVRQTVLDGETVLKSGTSEAQTIAAGEKAAIDLTVNVDNPTLWSTTNPKLYTVKTEILKGDTVVDTVETQFGYRYFAFDRDTGFSLNGENMKLKGVCMHHDQGALGAEANDRAIERQVEILKEMGCNSIRVTHNPADPALLEAADKHGMLIINELFDGWTGAKNGNYNDYARFFNRTVGADNNLLNKEDGDTWAEFDTRAAVQMSRNNPSVIMYSLCNEVQEGYGTISNGGQIAKNMIEWIEESDTTRKVTFGGNGLKNNNYIENQIAEEINKKGGVVGYNYANGSQYDAAFNNHSNWMFYGSETASAINSRGVYHHLGNYGSIQESDKLLTSYDRSRVGWGHMAGEAWYDIIQRDFMAGEYVWTGFDYLGEPTPWNGTGSGYVGGQDAPKSSYFGIVDTAGLPKDSYYLYQSVWNEDVNTLHVLPAWNEDVVATENGGVPVVVYSDAASVELFLTPTGGTERSLGKKTFTKKTTAAGYTYQVYEGSDKSSRAWENQFLTWHVPFEEGTIRAVAYDEKGEPITDTEGRKTVTTTGAAAKLNAKADRETLNAATDDLSYITIDVTDENGEIVPSATNKVTVTVEGAGTLAGLDNGKQSDHQSYQDDNRKALAGKLVAIVRSNGENGDIKVNITSDGLEPKTVTLKAEGASEEAKFGLKYSRNYFVKVGTIPTLPETVVKVDPDGTETNVAVEWNEIDPSNVAQAGSFSVAGTAEGQTVSVTVNVIDTVGAMLNYSTATMKGQKPVLPAARPAVMDDGSITEISLPVEWDMPEDSAFAEEGTVVINGTASVFGREYPITATVRVTEGNVEIGDSVTGAAHLSQSIPEGSQSDTLEAIKDGSLNYDPDSKTGENNNTCWTTYNYTYQNPENDTASVVFRYDTEQTIDHAVVNFISDTWSVTVPDANTTKWEISQDGENWTELNATETIGAFVGSGSVGRQPYTYTFEGAPVRATYVRMTVTVPEGKKGNHDHYKSVGMSEVELIGATTVFEVNTTATLASMTINGEAVDAEKLASKDIAIRDKTADIKAVSEGNASITQLPAKDGAIKILVQSEDGKTMNTYVVRTGVIDPADDSYDIPVELYNPATGSVQPGAANALENAFDGDVDTHWHSVWAGATNYDDQWVEIHFDEPTRVDGIRYLPRQDGSINGRITAFEIYALNDADEWVKITEGEWAPNSEWKLTNFDAVKTTGIRLKSTQAQTDSGKLFSSAAEIRLTTSPEEPEEPETLTFATLDRVLELARTMILTEFKDTAAFEAALAQGETTRTDATKQSQINSAVDTLHRALLRLRLTPDEAKVEALKNEG